MLSEEMMKLAGIEKIGERWQFFFDSRTNTEELPISPTPEAKKACPEDINLTPMSLSMEMVNEATVAHSEATVSKSKKKREQKKKRQLSKASSEKTGIKWGMVEEIKFKRHLSFDAVPSKGLFPLGLGDEEERGVTSVDEHIARKQADLITRALSCGVPIKLSTAVESTSSKKVELVQSSASASAGSSSDDAFHIHLETRQYDFKAGVHNPLFQPLSEEERLVILGPIATQLTTPSQSNHEQSQALCMPISEFNRELKNIRANRDNTGCSCKPLKLDKLSVCKMKSELAAHSSFSKNEIEKMSKADLTNNLREALKSCLMCTMSNCECVQLGVSCSAEVCGCLKHGHRPGQAQSCANPSGQSIYNPHVVREYRMKVLNEVNTEAKCTMVAV
jgi:hypothetical protein